MFIRIKDLQLQPLEFDEAFPPGTVEMGAENRQIAPLTVQGRAQLIEENRGHKVVLDDIRIVGRLATELEIGCARCLEPVRTAVEREFDLLYRPQGADRSAEEISVAEGEAEIGYYEGDSLLLEDLVREQLLLAVPYRLLCKDACKGLCPSCGRNLNAGDCDCEAKNSDPRWNALGGLRDKLKN